MCAEKSWSRYADEYIGYLTTERNILMSKLLSEMVGQLMEDVPADGGVPSTTQYENAIKDAVADFSEQCGVTQIGTLSIVSGIATYELPVDFLKLIRLESYQHDGVIYSEAGLIPLSAHFYEKYTIRNGQITFYPIPRYTLVRCFDYKAAWVGTVTDDEYPDIEYETLSEREVRIILLKAQEITLGKLSNAQAGTSIKYSFGAVSEDLGGTSEASRKTAYAVQTDYEAACRKYNGTIGSF